MIVNQLLCMVGLPRSGKSTRARWLAVEHNGVVVNPDSIRLAAHGQAFAAAAEPLIWWMARVQVQSLFAVGHKLVILDATSITHAARNEWVRPKEWATCWVPVSTPAEVCKERARLTNQMHMIGVIERMVVQQEPLSPEEAKNIYAEAATLDRNLYIPNEDDAERSAAWHAANPGFNAPVSIPWCDANHLLQLAKQARTWTKTPCFMAEIEDTIATLEQAINKTSCPPP